MDNYIRNKQIGIEDIRRLAKTLEDYAEDYRNKGKETENKEKEFEEKWERIRQQAYDNDQSFSYGTKDRDERDTEFKYSRMSVNVEYTVKYDNGRNITEKGYDWFVEHTDNAKNITGINISMVMSYNEKKAGKDKSEYKFISAYVWIDSSEVTNDYDLKYRITSDNFEEENDNLHKMIESNFYNCPERYNKTIKNRNVRIQAFSIAIGIILSYILFIVLKIVSPSMSEFFNKMLANKNVLVFGQWFAAVVLGNIFAAWYMLLLYKPILPRRSYVGYDRSSHKNVYRDNVEDYKESSEVRIRNLYDADIRRAKIEKLYKIGGIVILVQLVISLLLFLILK